MNEKVTGIVRTAKGGILYYNSDGKIISTGSIFDKVAPNPNLQRFGAVVFYSNNSDRTLYGIANGSTSWYIQTPTYTITANLGLNQLMQILAEEVFFLVSGGGGSQDLTSVLIQGNNAGLNDIDLNGQKILNVFRVESETNADLKLETLGTGTLSFITGAANKITIPEIGNILAGANIDVNNNDLLNVDTITSSADLMLNPVGSIDANGKTLNMTLGEIHNVPLIHSQNNTDLTIEGKGTGTLYFKTNTANKLTIPATGYITTQVEIAPKSIVDSLGSLGTSGQFLKSTGVGINWATPTDPAGWSYIVKSANQDVTNNATLQDDTELQFSVVAAGHYMIELDLVISVSDAAVAKFKQSFLLSAGTQKGSGNAISNSNAGAAAVIGMFAAGTALSTTSTIGTFLSDLTGGLFSLKIIYSFIASANATFKYQFANSVAVVGATSRVWKGSILKYKRID